MPISTLLLPLAPGEAVFAPFFDPGLAPGLPARLEPGAAGGLRRSFFWCGLMVEWDECAPGAMGATLTYDSPLPTAPWTQAVFCLTMPDHLAVRLEWRDGAANWHTWGEPVAGTATRLEIERDLPAGGTTGCRLIFTALRPGAGAILLAWVGVRQRPLYDTAWQTRPAWSPEWPGLIRPEAEWRIGAPQLGLLFGADDLARLRARRDTPGWREVWRFLRERAALACARAPEPDIQDFVPWGDERFTTQRERNRGEWYMSLPLVALVGVIDEDPRCLRHALRLLMAILHTKHWTCSPECRTTGSTWDTRCFLEEMHATAVALAYDWLGSALTPHACDLLATSLWDKGIAVIERDLAKYENIHHINQAPWFNRGRLLATLVIESLWPRDAGHAERIVAELDADLGRYLLADGGIDEGPGYLATTQEVTLVAYTAYARRRGKNIRDVLPALFEQSADYYATLASGVPGEFTPEGDASRRALVSDALPMLAALFPERGFGDWAQASLPRAGEFSYFQHYVGMGIYAFMLGPDTVPPLRAARAGRSLLPVTGLLADQREEKGHSLRLQIIGCKAHPSHSHRDKGAFIAELDGDPVFIDRGMIRYEDFRHQLLKRSDLHNVLTPLGEGDASPDQAPPEIAVIPAASGENGAFAAQVDLGNVWREWMRECRRVIESPTVEGWTVRDTGELRAPGAVCFHLHSPYPFTGEKGIWRVTTPRFAVEIVAPWAVRALAAPDLIDSAYRPIHHLRIVSAPLTTFDLQTEFRRLDS